MDRIKCSNCKVSLPESHFEKKRNGDFYKMCNQCREYKRKIGQKNKCQHNRQKARCRKCGGNGICEHDKQKAHCKKCGGSQVCVHDKIKSICRECGGSSICQHDKVRSLCKDCGGNGICEHDKLRNICRECKGSGICEHDKIKQNCRECGGVSICEHDKRKNRCPTCNPAGYTAMIVRSAVHRGINGSSKSKKSIEYLGCDIQTFREHIEKQFVDDMSWENQGAWHIDHIIPLKYNNPTDEQIIERLHYKNCQPLWACDNLKKGNRYIG